VGARPNPINLVPFQAFQNAWLQNSKKDIRLMITSIRLMGAIETYALNNYRHSARAAVQLSLKLVRE
jgi:hypothetical protein